MARRLELSMRHLSSDLAEVEICLLAVVRFRYQVVEEKWHSTSLCGLGKDNLNSALFPLIDFRRH